MCHIPREFPAENAPLAAPLPLSCSEVAAGAAAQVPPVRVGAAVAAGAAPGQALVHVLAAPEGLVEVEARGTNALEAAQGVVAGGRATGRGAGALVLICMESRNRGITELWDVPHRYRVTPTGTECTPQGTGHLPQAGPPLTHALVPLVVLHVALGAAAAVPPEHVLAAVLAPVVPVTLVHICTQGTHRDLSSGTLQGAPGGGWLLCPTLALQLGTERHPRLPDIPAWMVPDSRCGLGCHQLCSASG